MTKLVELASADRLGGGDTRANGNRAWGLGGRDRVTRMTKAEELAGVGRWGGWNRGAMRARRVDEHQMAQAAQVYTRTKEDEVCGLARLDRENTLTRLTKLAGVDRLDEVDTLNTVMEQAWADRLGGADTQAKGDKAGGLDRPDRVNSMPKLTKPAGVDRLGGGWNRGATRSRRVDGHWMPGWRSRTCESKNADLSVGAGVGVDHWALELELRWQAPETPRPEPGDLWGFNFVCSSGE